MKPREVARGVHQVGLRGVNVFLIETGDGLVLVDAGLRGSPPRITEAIYSLGRLPQDVVAIVVTHTHRDHVGGLAEMKRRTGAEVWMHPADAALVRDGRYGRPFGRGRGRAGGGFVRVVNALPSPRGESVAVAHEVSDGEVLPFDGLRAVHTPGHTAGHLALLLPRDGGVLFVGDAAANMLKPGSQRPQRRRGREPAQPGEAGGPRVRGGLLRPRPSAPRQGERCLPRARAAPRADRLNEHGGRRWLNRAASRKQPHFSEESSGFRKSPGLVPGKRTRRQAMSEAEDEAQVGLQFSLYPLRQAHLHAAIEAAVQAAATVGLDVAVGRLSTFAPGDEESVFAGLRAAFVAARSFGPTVMVVTLSSGLPSEETVAEIQDAINP